MVVTKTANQPDLRWLGLEYRGGRFGIESIQGTL
jgi:hypothetical protein